MIKLPPDLLGKRSVVSSLEQIWILGAIIVHMVVVFCEIGDWD